MNITPHLRPLSAAFLAATLALTALADSPVGWAWTGGVTADTAVITARIETDAPAALRIIETDTTVATTLAEPMANGALHRYPLGELKPDTAYTYAFIDADGTPLDDELRTFRTFPKAGTPASYRFAVASCAKGMNSPVFTAASHQGARFFLHTGDFHYHDIAENRVETFRSAFNAHLSQPRLRTLLAHMPLLYQWDDHDFGPNDSNRHSPSREASLLNYRQLVPHHPLDLAAGDPHGPVDQAFTVGRVRFILSDLRSQRDPEARRMMNAAQDAWFRKELLAARDAGHPLIFWMSSVPWNGPANTYNDRWQGYADHRREIADFIKANNLAGRVVILSGDAHLTAIDDGANADFATDGGAPIPVFQAGPIYNKGSYKGGPYNRGARYETPEGKMLTHFGLVDIEDDGAEIRVTFSGRDGTDGIGDTMLLSERDAEGPVEWSFTVR
ncbi:MAG: alkaline phosphatase D family protein [Verrucomicrobiota bacterium]